MKKDNLAIKKNIGLPDIINAVEYITASYFTGDLYTPYFVNESKIGAVLSYFIVGYELEENESIYEEYNHDNDLHDLVDKFLEGSPSADRYFTNIMSVVMAYVKEKVEYEKECRIHESQSLKVIANMCEEISELKVDMDMIIAAMNTLGKLSSDDIDKGREILDKMVQADTLDPDTIVDIMVKTANTNDVAKNAREIIDAKNTEIEELKKQIEELKEHKEE